MDSHVYVYIYMYIHSIHSIHIPYMYRINTLPSTAIYSAPDKAGARLQELNRDVAGVVIRQPNKRLQKVLEMPQQKHWETTALDKAGEAQGEGIRLGEFISQVVGQLLKQGHVEVGASLLS